MSRLNDCKRIFRHHRPLQEADMARLAVAGGNGAYRRLIDDYGEDPNNLHLGVSVQVDHRIGSVTISYMPLVGKWKVSGVNTKDFWLGVPVKTTLIRVCSVEVTEL